jgi:protein-S-isoprenylcysteine O-methyltransferase Ste14
VRQIILFAKTLFPAACAVAVFGLVTWQFRRFDNYFPIAFPPWMAFVGIVLMAAGMALGFVCFALFAVGGALTEGPNFPDPTVFIESGPYRYVRNPMAAALLTTILGWGCFERSASIVLFALVMAGVMHLFVVFVEEPKLERRFGKSYLAYKSRVKRWMPS